MAPQLVQFLRKIEEPRLDRRAQPLCADRKFLEYAVEQRPRDFENSRRFARECRRRPLRLADQRNLADQRVRAEDLDGGSSVPYGSERDRASQDDVAAIGSFATMEQDIAGAQYP